MAMRETVRSLRLYFVISGVLGMLSNGGGFLGEEKLDPAWLVIDLVGCGFSLAYIYMGFALKRMLKSSPHKVVSLLHLSLVWVGLLSVFTLLGPAAGIGFGLTVLAAAALIIFYLLKNVRRLSRAAE